MKEEKKIARHSQDTHWTTHDQPSSSSSSGSGANRDNTSAQNRQRSDVSEHEQDVDMNNEHKGKHDPTEGSSSTAVNKARETLNDDDRDSKKKRLSSVATHCPLSRHT